MRTPIASTSDIGVPSSLYTNDTKQATEADNDSIRSVVVGANFSSRNTYDTRPFDVRVATPLSMHSNLSTQAVVGVTDPDASHIDFGLRQHKVMQGYNTERKLNSSKEVVVIHDPKRVGLSE